MVEKPTYEELEKKIQALKQDKLNYKRKEKLFKESEKYLKRAQHISKTGSWYYDWHSETEIWSDECFNLYGIKQDNYPDNIIPESLSEQVYSNPQEIQNLSDSLAEKHDKYEIEFATVPINGKIKTIHSYCEVERDNNGGILKVFGTDHDITERVEIENKLKESYSELSTLFKISSIINESVTMEFLLPSVLKAVTQFEIFQTKPKGGIFLVEKEKMILAAHLGHDKEFLKSHENMKPGVCLCGLVAQSGEMIISDDCFNDKRHTIQFLNMAEHGHIIVPLKSQKGIEGVLYLYTKKGTAINNHVQNLFETIGFQIGTMISNAKLYEELKSLSLYDPLTGLANRRMMDIHLNKLMVSSKRSNKKFYILMLDIDYFKKYNDTFGHDAGDAVLNNVGTIFKKTIRESDLIARYGGEEFLIAISNTQENSIDTVAERIRKNIEEETEVTISIGISCFRKGLDSKDLIKEADTALYKAKNLGRNRVVSLNVENNKLKSDLENNKI